MQSPHHKLCCQGQASTLHMVLSLKPTALWRPSSKETITRGIWFQPWKTMGWHRPTHQKPIVHDGMFGFWFVKCVRFDGSSNDSNDPMNKREREPAPELELCFQYLVDSSRSTHERFIRPTEGLRRAKWSDGHMDSGRHHGFARTWDSTCHKSSLHIYFTHNYRSYNIV